MLSVDTALAPSVIDDVAPPNGTSYLVLTITLKNAGAPRALSTDPALFSLETTGALIIQMTGLVENDGCSATISVAAGGQTECEVGFEIPTGQTPSKLLYDDLRGDKATASIPAIMAPPSCQTVFGWLSSPSNPSQCLGCVESAVGDSGECASASAAYQSMCKSCASCDSDPATVCSCEMSCDTAACQKLFAVFTSCVESACTTDCASSP